MIPKKELLEREMKTRRGYKKEVKRLNTTKRKKTRRRRGILHQ